jgi:[ribosomal protein S5]-alanine N-acetyltransferase
MLQLNFQPFPQLTTQRLCLRETTLADAPALFEIRSNEQVMKYVGRPRPNSVADIEKLIMQIKENKERGEGILWAITPLHQPENYLGNICYWRIDKDNHRAELGYLLHPDHWNKGYVTEAIKTVLEYGFEQMHLHSAEAQLDPANEASAMVLKKNGFVQEALFKENHFYNGKYGDTAVYGIVNNLHRK